MSEGAPESTASAEHMPERETPAARKKIEGDIALWTEKLKVAQAKLKENPEDASAEYYRSTAFATLAELQRELTRLTDTEAG